eukprot:5059757-Heterocapsa_arctica.AAC.1
MAFAGPVRLSPWIKPYYRDTLHNVRRAKDLPLLFVLPKESIADLIERYDLDAIADYDRQAINGNADCVRHFAMPCNTIIPEVIDFDPNQEPAINWRVPTDESSNIDSVPFRRKPRFDDNVLIEE